MDVVPVRVPQVDLDDVERRNIKTLVTLVHGLQFRLELDAVRSRQRKMFEFQVGLQPVPGAPSMPTMCTAAAPSAASCK